MYFQFVCGRCGKSLKARQEHSGRRVVCPYCRAHVTVPQPEGLESPATDQPEERPASPGPQPSAAGAKSEEKSARSGVAKQVDGTNVSMLWSGLMGLGGAAGFYLLVAPFHSTYFGKLFIKAGTGAWVPFVTAFFMGWAVAMLILKYRKLKRQRQSMLFDLLPSEIGSEINEENLGHFLQNVVNLPGNARESFLVNRVKRGLEHFVARKSASEVATMLASQSEIDANAVESSYAILNVFIWAIPILGFIGTVIGISAAVGGFSGHLDAASDVAALKESLNNVTGGLATAFDTTLVALVMSMLVMFPTSSMKKAEEDLLNWVDEYCNENLLKRLNDGRQGAGPSGGATAIDVRRAINAAMADHHAELQTWTRKLDAELETWHKKLDADWLAWSKKLEAVGKTLAKHVAGSLLEVNQQVASSLQEANQQALDSLQQVNQQVVGSLQEVNQQVVGSLQEVSNQEQSLFEGKIQQLKDLDEMTNGMRGAAQSLSSYCEDLQTGLASLAQVLERLGERQVIVQQVERPRRRGWFFSRRDGG